MAIKRPKPVEIIVKLQQVEVLMGQGMRWIDAIRQITVTEQTYYRWKKKYGGVGTEQLKELKRLQKENERSRRAVSDLTLDKLILKEAASGNFWAHRVGGLALTACAVGSRFLNDGFAAFWASTDQHNVDGRQNRCILCDNNRGHSRPPLQCGLCNTTVGI
tara:strand:- start:645 stop:1127 length:483 start_codon:yes stop_codon:yes gene_type:complete